LIDLQDHLLFNTTCREDMLDHCGLGDVPLPPETVEQQAEYPALYFKAWRMLTKALIYHPSMLCPSNVLEHLCESREQHAGTWLQWFANRFPPSPHSVRVYDETRWAANAMVSLIDANDTSVLRILLDSAWMRHIKTYGQVSEMSKAMSAAIEQENPEACVLLHQKLGLAPQEDDKAGMGAEIATYFRSALTPVIESTQLTPTLCDEMDALYKQEMDAYDALQWQYTDGTRLVQKTFTQRRHVIQAQYNMHCKRARVSSLDMAY
jgi:hypothetical protein